MIQYDPEFMRELLNQSYLDVEGERRLAKAFRERTGKEPYLAPIPYLTIKPPEEIRREAVLKLDDRQLILEFSNAFHVMLFRRWWQTNGFEAFDRWATPE